MAKFSKTGNWYVDSYYGNDMSGTGSTANPFKTLNRAFTAASANHRVICRGYFAEGLPTTSKGINWEGEGLAICDGSTLPDGTVCFNSANTNSLKGFRLTFWQGASFAILNSNGTVALEECELHYCFLNSSTGGSSGLPRFSINRCILTECRFSATSSSNYAGIFMNSTFVRCSGTVGAGTSGFIIRNNQFIGPNFGIVLPASRPGGMEFNYNNIDGTLNGLTNAQWQAYGNGDYQVNGYAVPAVDVFNDFVSGRDSITFWQNDFTMKPNCILRDAASDGLEIGAKRVGYRYSANDLWNTYRAASQNLTYSQARGLMLLDPAQGRGTYESSWIEIGANIQFDMANLLATFVVQNANASQFLGTRPAAPSSTTNQRRAFDFKLAVANNNLEAPDWKSQEFYRRVRLDGAGKGIADDSYNPAAVQIPQGSFLKIMFEMNNMDIVV